MPLINQTFSQIITFERLSGATYFDATGTLQTAATNIPRFDYNPSTLAAQGLLIEEARTNLALQSQDFATTWTTSSSPTITTNTTVAPDGTTTADTLASTAAGSYVAQIVTFTGDGTKTYSFFIKSGTSSNTRIFLRDTTAAVSGGQADITWAAGVPSVVVTNGSLQYLQACPNGWYRLAVIVDSVVAANTNQIRIQPDNVSGTGDVIFWGAQIENAAFSTSYIPTTTTALTRNADEASVNTLSPWYNASEGTLFADWTSFIPNGTSPGSTYAAGFTNNIASSGAAQLTIQNRPVSNQIRVWQSTTGGGLDDFITPTGTTFQGRAAATYGGGSNVTASANGGAVVTMTNPIQTTTFNALLLGLFTTASTGTGSNYLNGYLRRITYYPRALSSAELQAITV